MIHCFLTGVEFRLEDAFVLNRRQAHDLLAVLKDRAASLRRVIDQLSPLDEEDRHGALPQSVRTWVARKRHRLVCKAVADALAPGFPEIRLFLPWPEYHTRARLASLHGLHRHRERCGLLDAMDVDVTRQEENLGAARDAPT